MFELENKAQNEETHTMSSPRPLFMLQTAAKVTRRSCRSSIYVGRSVIRYAGLTFNETITIFSRLLKARQAAQLAEIIA